MAPMHDQTCHIGVTVCDSQRIAGSALFLSRVRHNAILVVNGTSYVVSGPSEDDSSTSMRISYF
jgi:hypothetical protein